MKGKTLRNVSVVSIVLAVALALYAVRLGRQLSQPHEPAQVEAPELAKIVVAAVAIEPGREITAESLRLEGVSLEPEGAFHSLEEVVGRTSSSALVPGEPVMEKHFRVNGAITRRLEPGERAMAVAVDGVIGMGGFIQPGDRVDVLVYVPRDMNEVDDTHARVLLEDIRVLAYGEKIESDAEAAEGKPTDARTAVLAVRHADVSKLMLGASKGRLRLALRSPGDEGLAAGDEAGSISLDALAGDYGRGKAPKQKAKSQGPTQPRRVVLRGDAGGIARY